MSKNSEPPSVKWTIGILTVPERRESLEQLLKVLRPQLRPGIEVIVHENNGGDLGELRQHLLDQAAGEYISFIDDDDLVAPDYVESIYPLLDGFDCIGFKLAYYEDGVRQRPVIHSIRYKEWSQDDDGFYRGYEPKNPIRRKLMVSEGFRSGWNADEDIARRLMPKLSTEHFINKELYIYQHSSKGSLSP